MKNVEKVVMDGDLISFENNDLRNFPGSPMLPANL